VSIDVGRDEDEGDAYPKGCMCHDSIQAFTHFTFVQSKGYCALAGLRGRYVKGRGGGGGSFVLTTPVVHSRDVYSYHKTNLGSEGMGMVMRAHKCNDICRALGLPQYQEGSEKDASKSVEWFYKAAAQGNCVAQYNLGDLYYKEGGVKAEVGWNGFVVLSSQHLRQFHYQLHYYHHIAFIILTDYHT
ncbi:hypothetical protein EON65_12605, partial [archaeon]